MMSGNRGEVSGCWVHIEGEIYEVGESSEQG